MLLSGGVDSSFVAASASGQLEAGLTAVASPRAPDLPYASAVARALGLAHAIVVPSARDVEECLDLCIEVSRSIDPIEIACGIPLCLALRRARELGFRSVATGDGGDEIFVGYRFLLRKSLREVEDWLERVERTASFSSVAIGAALGVDVLPALFDERVREVARLLSVEDRVALIARQRVGKAPLRRALALMGLPLVAWREKEPILRGSGFESLIEEWSSRASSSDAELATRLGMRLPSRAHLYLLKRYLSLGLEPPSASEGSGPRCPFCGSALANGFCRFCGTYVDSSGVPIPHYSDELMHGAAPRSSASRGSPRR